MTDPQDSRPARGDGTAPSWRDVLDDPPVRVGEWTERDSVKLGIGVGLLLAGAGVGLGILLIAQGVRADCTGSDVAGPLLRLTPTARASRGPPWSSSPWCSRSSSGWSAASRRPPSPGSR